MFAVIYRFKLQPHQEKNYQKYWRTIANYFIDHCGALGSCLHKCQDGLWLAYSRWPNKKTRDLAWPEGDTPNDSLPDEIQATIIKMKNYKEENKHLEKFDEICMEVVDDLLIQPGMNLYP